MTLSLESLYTPLNEFFLSRFKAADDSPILFRFSKYGSVLTDRDFRDPAHPELGYVPSLAIEQFSNLVNHIPVDTGDGVNVALSDSLIDDAYFFRLLTPAVPAFPVSAGTSSKQAIVDAFSVLKASALKTWANVVSESSSGFMLQYRPSLATPENWYDQSSADAWTKHSLDIRESVSTPAPAGAPSTPLWRLRLSDEVLMRVSNPIAPTIAPRSELVTAMADPDAHVALHSAARFAAPRLGRAVVAEVALRPTAIAAAVAEPAAVPEPTFDRAAFSKNFATLNVAKRLALVRAIGESAPTRPAETKHFSISFEYCLVSVRRPWYLGAFVDSDSWSVPAAKKGELNMNGAADSLSLLPIALLAVRNLVIEADWAAEDVASISQATHFGPFAVANEMVENKLSRPGLQVVGWVLQKMQPLPPQDSNSIT